MLRGLWEVSQRPFGNKARAQYKQIYKEQKLIFEIIPFLNSKGFKLRDIKHQGPFGDELVEANVFFTRAPRTDVEKTFLEFWGNVK